jgi:hypothetical protein
MKNKKGKRKTVRTYGGDARADAIAQAEKSKNLIEELKQHTKDAEKKAKEDEKKVKMIDERKITDIDIKFYKSNFENNNPFPYYEQVVLNRTGIDVISDLYGVEELFPTFKEELQYLADPKKYINDPTKKDIDDQKKKDKFKPFKRKHIKIEHTKNDKSAPTFDIFVYIFYKWRIFIRTIKHYYGIQSKKLPILKNSV